MKNFFKPIGEIIKTTYRILTSRKGQSWLFYNAVLVVMALKLKGDFGTFATWFFAGLAAFGVGVQHDKKVEENTNGQPKV